MTNPLGSLTGSACKAHSKSHQFSPFLRPPPYLSHRISPLDYPVASDVVLYSHLVFCSSHAAARTGGRSQCKCDHATTPIKTLHECPVSLTATRTSSHRLPHDPPPPSPLCAQLQARRPSCYSLNTPSYISPVSCTCLRTLHVGCPAVSLGFPLSPTSPERPMLSFSPRPL